MKYFGSRKLKNCIFLFDLSDVYNSCLVISVQWNYYNTSEWLYVSAIHVTYKDFAVNVQQEKGRE
jgi:hypothetical protein